MKNAGFFFRLRIAHRLLLIAFSFTLPIAVLTYLMVQGINYDIRFTEMEIMGNAYQRPLEKLLKALPEHEWILADIQSGKKDSLEALLKKQSEIDGIFSELAVVDGQIGKDLQFTEEGLRKRGREDVLPSLLKSRWDEVKLGYKSMNNSDIQERHSRLVQDVRTMITHSGDLSNLILDPDLDSYYMMDITLLALPQTQDRITVILNRADLLLKKSEWSLKEKIDMASLGAHLKESDLARIAGDVQTSISEDPNFYGRQETLQSKLSASFKEYQNATESFLLEIEKIVNGEPNQVNAEEIMSSGKAAREASFRFWDVCVAEMDQLLKTRVNYFKSGRVKSILLSLTALAFACFLVWMIARSISIPLRSLTSVTERLAKEGNLKYNIDVRQIAFVEAVENSKDNEESTAYSNEVALLAKSLNSLLSSMRSLAQQAQAIANDDLQNILLNRKMEGDLADAFARMVTFLRDVAEKATLAANGDLTVRISRKGVLSDAFNKMIDGLTHILKQLKDAGLQVASASVQIRSAAEEQASGASEQSSTVAEISTTMEELARTAHQIAKNAQVVSLTAEKMLSEMSQIQNTVVHTSKKILTLGEKSQSIGGIVKIIDDLAEQTNLLALNAAIEAAHAGEAGKGFAIVASEVRKLSERSTESTGEIRSLINEIQAETNAAVMGIEESTKQVTSGLAMVQESVQQAKEISMATGQQRSASEQVVMAMKNIDQVAKQFASATKQAAAAASQLDQQVEGLKKVLSGFQVN
jgi:methyl-accepting chemotaxis protein